MPKVSGRAHQPQTVHLGVRFCILDYVPVRHPLGKNIDTVRVCDHGNPE